MYIYRVVFQLQGLADGYLPSGVTLYKKRRQRLSRVLQVVHYFRDTINRLRYEMIIRSIVQKLSLLPDFNIAQAAQKSHNDEKFTALV